jgi:2-polyprenyl-6-methoxyphenol hydroxylase-like FAD-dependent oxidoreductase
MSEPRRISVSVVIVGGGPVGLALAVTLGKAGVSCALVERQLEPSAIPRGQNLTARSLEHFYYWDCADELRAARLLPPGFPIGGITAYQSLASEYWYAPAGREMVADFYYQRNERLPQYLTESVLRNRVSELGPVTVLFGWSAASVQQDGGGVRVTALQDPGGGRCEIEADYLAGCDGAHSQVREQAGIVSGGADFGQRMVLAVFRSRELHERLERFPLRTTYRVLHPELKGYWWFFGRVDPAGTWFFHAPVHKDATAANLDAHALIDRAAGFGVACDFQHVGFWDLRIDIADSYRQGRVFIAGDAAHSHPPYGAHGLNTGLEDAVNLGWKLAAVLHGWGGPDLLDSYTQERRPVFAGTGEMITEGIAQDRAFLERYNPQRDRGEFELAWSGRTSGEVAPPSYEPHFEGSPIVWGPPGAACGVRGHHTFEARAGHHLAPLVLSSGANIFERLAGGFTLIALGGDQEPTAAFQAAAADLRMPLQVIADTFDGQRAAYGQRFILIRPDQHVAWTGNDPPADAAAVLRRAIGAAASQAAGAATGHTARSGGHPAAGRNGQEKC